MEGCLLCLEINKAVCITGNSSQWEELDIKNIVEKHFWAMHTIQSSSWLCNTCWQELHDFHKFYIRIEESHTNFGKLMKTENEPALQDPIENIHDDKTSIRDVLYESQVEPEISMPEPLMEEQLAIKKEQEEFLDNDDYDDDDDMPLKPKRKRKRREKDTSNEMEMEVTEEDPLNKPKKSKQCKAVESKIKRSRRTVKKINMASEPTQREQSKLKQRTDSKYIPEESNDSLGSPNANDSGTDSNYDFDKDSLENNELNQNLNSQAISDEKDKLIAENFKIICILCQIPMENFHLLRKHFKMEHKHIKKGYVICCNKKIFSRCALFDHVNHHLDPNYFKCQQCDKVFKDRLCLTGHLKRHEGNTEKKFSCDICDKSFSIPSLLKYHKMTHLPEEEKQFPCSECGKRFGTELSLTNHVRAVHLNKYAKICEICGKSLSSADVFERHMLEHEGKTAPTISCDICGLLLTSKKGLKRHKNTIHPVGGHQEYTCSICSKVSSNRQAHERHVKFSHEMGYNHKCTMCEKAFKKPRALKEHMATHTGDVLYTCQWCAKTFNSSANFHSHRKKAHPIEWEEANRKKYACNLPPSLKAPTSNNVTDLPTSIYMHLTKNGVTENIK